MRLEMETRRAINYPALTGPAQIGDEVLLNITAQKLKLGTGGFDFVSANLSRSLSALGGDKGHIMKGRYLPCQQAVLTLEEQGRYADIWERNLEEMPVLVGQLHSQIAPAAAGLSLSGRRKVAYIMTDVACLPIAFSRLVRDLKSANLLRRRSPAGRLLAGTMKRSPCTLPCWRQNIFWAAMRRSSVRAQVMPGRERNTASAASSRHKISIL